ncbi:MAG: hypothetical protein ACTSWY_03865 [Promethearchaeota archaeon]
MAFTVSYSNKVTDFLRSIQKVKEKTYLFMDVRVTEEACFFGAEIIVNILKKEPKNHKNKEIIQRLNVGDINDINLLISSDVMQYFHESENLVLDLKGKLRKKIVCTSPKPIIKNVCKIEKEV